MTHSGATHNVGDRGQQYEVRATGYPKDGVNVIGWSATLEGAQRMMAAILKAPGCTSASIFDRELNATMITRYGGILR